MGHGDLDAIRAQAWEALHGLEGHIPSNESCHALAVIGATYFHGGSLRHARTFMEESADHGRRAGLDYAESFSRASLLDAAWFGPDPVAEVVALAENDLAWARARGAMRLEATALSVLAGGEAMRCNNPRSRGFLDELVSIRGQLRFQDIAGEYWVERIAEVHLLLGEPQRAEAAMREICDVLERAGVEEYLMEALPRFGEALYALNRFEAAEALALRVERTRASLDVETMIRSRKLLGKTLARRGAGGESHARAAVEIANTTDMINLTADALTDLAEVLRLARQDGAPDALRTAITLYEDKGNLASLSRASRLLRETEKGSDISRARYV